MGRICIATAVRAWEDGRRYRWAHLVPSFVEIPAVQRITDSPPERAEKPTIRLERRQGRILIPAATQNWKQAPIGKPNTPSAARLCATIPEPRAHGLSRSELFASNPILVSVGIQYGLTRFHASLTGYSLVM